MKKLLVVLSLSMVFNPAVKAQKMNAAKVPVAVKASFEKNYPSLPVKWEKEGEKYEAGFKQNGKTMSALFEPDGTLTEIETDIKIAELPADAISYLKSNYNGQKITDAAKITKANGVVNFEAGIKGKDIIFDAVGKFIKIMKD